MRAAICVLAAWCVSVSGAQYYVDSTAGADDNSGVTPNVPWRSLSRVNTFAFKAGDTVLFRADRTWSGHLIITAQGEPDRPVVFRRYGEGRRPRIDTAGEFEDAVLLRNARQVEIRDFELTNLGPTAGRRRGVHIVGENAGTLTNVLVSNLFIHDVNGTERIKDNGGIIFRTLGERVPTRFHGLRIERNIIWKVDRSGIVAQSYHALRTRWFPSTNVVIRDNWLGDIGGDGITPWATDGCVVEHNIVQGANERAGTYNAGIWPWSTDNTLIRLNRASGVKTLLDGQGFDSDFNSRNTILEYNLSHDNEGGFLLICTPGQRKENENCGNIGTIVRCNLSRNDHARSFHISAAEQTLIERNAIYTAPGDEVQLFLMSDWSGWANGLQVQDNLFYSSGVARYGHQISRNKDGSYGIAPGWGPATNIVFRDNRYVGRQEDRPLEVSSDELAAPRPIRFDDWPGPQFDPRQPETFGEYMGAHRAWMLSLMERQFGRVAEARRTSNTQRRSDKGSTRVAFPLKQSANQRYLVDQNDRPFLVIGDTPWSLIAQLDEADIARYLDDRARRGFNALIVNLIEHKYATHAPANRANLAPFLNLGDFGQPNPAYFEFAHRAVAAANERGMSVWLCPAYLGWAGGDEGFFKEIKAAGPSVLRAYGRWVGERFKDLPNLVWMIGGDFAVPKAERWAGTELALGLRDGGAGQLITAHGGQTTAVETFGPETWLGVETAYGYQPDLWRLFQSVYSRRPIRPFVLIESTYEGEHDSSPDQIRRQAWWAILCGGCGQFFGNNPLWHFDGPSLFPFKGTWQEALNSVGSRDMARLGAFFARLPWYRLEPDVGHGLLASGPGEGKHFIAAASTRDQRLAILYIPADGSGRRELTLNLRGFPGEVTVRWFNPARDVASALAPAILPNRDDQTVRTPGDNGTGVNDWVLVLESAK